MAATIYNEIHEIIQCVTHSFYMPKTIFPSRAEGLVDLIRELGGALKKQQRVSVWEYIRAIEQRYQRVSLAIPLQQMFERAVAVIPEDPIKSLELTLAPEFQAGFGKFVKVWRTKPTRIPANLADLAHRTKTCPVTAHLHKIFTISGDPEIAYVRFSAVWLRWSFIYQRDVNSLIELAKQLECLKINDKLNQRFFLHLPLPLDDDALKKAIRARYGREDTRNSRANKKARRDAARMNWDRGPG